MASLQTLIDMGFPDTKAQKAMEVCNNNVEQAMEWLLAHDSDSKPAAAAQMDASNTSPDLQTSEEAATAAGTENDSTAEAKSIKCDECQKLFKTTEEVEFHSVKSGHRSFSESTEEKKQLTEEEKKEKLKELESKIKQRRLEKEADEQKEKIEKEKKRIEQSRQYSEMKKKQDDLEIKKLVDERKREKMEDKLARQRVKDQIESDRRARKEREQMFAGTQPTPAAPAPPSSVASQSVPKKDYDSTRLQIRLPSGSPLVQNFNAKESLSAVRLWVSLNRTDGIPSDHPFNLSTTFPRKIFTEEDMDKPLNSLGLVPSAVLAVTK